MLANHVADHVALQRSRSGSRKASEDHEQSEYSTKQPVVKWQALQPVRVLDVRLSEKCLDGI